MTLLPRCVTFLLTLLLPLLTLTSLRGEEIKLNGQTFVLPDGFTIEEVASPKLAPRPITASFDEAGNLYVADSSGSNDPVQKQLEEKPHRILRLSDADRDGVFDKSEVFADKFMFPEGTLWHDGSLYVSAPPSIWKLTDRDGDGVAEERTEWFQGKTLTGCANDLHGPYLGRDGWIYWCKGAFAEQNYTLPNGKPFSTRASHIFRCRPDGSGLEPVMTGGMDNPVDVVSTRTGERFFTTTFLVHPGDGKRDGIIHAIYGGVYGKDHGVLEGHPRTGDLLPPLSHLGAAAPCGLEVKDNVSWGEDYAENIFACCFNMHKVTRERLTPIGGTYHSESTDFLVSSNVDFHPTDILEDADGSLLVVDTGGWYKLCCPTSQFHKPDILGAIYRIRRSDQKYDSAARSIGIELPKTDAAELLKIFKSAQPVLRQSAVQQLRRLGETAVSEIAKELDNEKNSKEVKQDLLWTLAGIESSKARKVIRECRFDDNSLAHTQSTIISLHRDKEATATLVHNLQLGGGATRAALEGLGRVGAAEAIPEISSLKPTDAHTEHSVVYALYEIGNVDSLLQQKNSSRPDLVWTAIEMLNPDKVQVSEVLKLLNDEATRSRALRLIDIHSDWSDSLVDYTVALAKSDSIAKSQILPSLLRRITKTSEGRKLLISLLEDPIPLGESNSRRLALSVISESGEKPLQADIAAVLVNLTEKQTWASRDGEIGELLSLVSEMGIPNEELARLKKAAQSIYPRSELAPEDFLYLVWATTAGTKLNDLEMSMVQRSLQSNMPSEQRSLAINILDRVDLSETEYENLAAQTNEINLIDLPRFVGLFTRTKSSKVGMKLLNSVRQRVATGAVNPELLKGPLKNYDASIQNELAALGELFQKSRIDQVAKLEKIYAAMQPGDSRRGHQIFQSTKASCISCHTMGYLGGKVGPDLSKIGDIRTDKDLLEAIVFPSVSFVRSYEAVSVVTKDGEVVSGIIRDQNSLSIQLATNATDVKTILRSDIEEMQPSPVSIMPSGFDQQLTPQDLADLIAYLKSPK